MTQTLTPQYTSATLQVYYCRLWCELSLKKGIAVNYLFIPIYTNYTNTQQQQQQQKEKKHYHDINIVIREMNFFFVGFKKKSSQAFPFLWDE